MQEPTNLTKLNAAVLEAMQRLAELRAERTIPQAAAAPLNEALRQLGEAFALSRRQSPEPPTQELTNQRLSRIFLENEKFFAATLGNHDSVQSRAVLEDLGCRVLINQSVEIEHQGAKLRLTGLDDVHSFYSKQAVAALDAGMEGLIQPNVSTH